MKRLIALLVVLALILLVVVGCDKKQNGTDTDSTGGTTPLSGDPVRIMVFTSLTGVNAAGGKMDSQAAKLAAKHVNEEGGVLGGRPLELTIVDATSETTQAPLVFENALSSAKYTGVIGSNTSSITLTQLPILEKYQVPAIVGSVNAKITDSGYKFIIRPGCIGDQMAKVNVELLLYLAEKSGKDVKDYKVGIVYENSAYGMDTAAGYKDYCNEAGLQVAVEESYPAKAFTDASPIVTKMKQAGVDLVMAVSLAEDAKLLINTMKSLQYTPLLFGGGEGFIWPTLYEEMGDDVNGIISSAVWNWDQKNNYKIENWDEICEEYKEMFNERFLAEQGGEMYGFIRMFAEAIDKAGTDDPIAVRDELLKFNVDNSKWLTLTPEGNVRINPENGQGIGSNAVLVQWQDGIPRTVWPLSIAAASVIEIGD
jgi:branched-chain amino acid transport system substrate-binding protein